MKIGICTGCIKTILFWTIGNKWWSFAILIWNRSVPDYKCLYNCAIMGRKCDLTPSDKDITTSELSKGKSTLEISKIIGRCHQTRKRFVAPTKVPKRVDKGHSSVVSQCSLSRMKCEAVNNPGLTSWAFFRSIGEATMSRSCHYCLLKKGWDISETSDKASIDKSTHIKAFEMGKGEH